MNWKDIPGYEGFYQVSDCGQVKSLGREKTKGPGNYKRKDKILKPDITSGYYRVHLSKFGKTKKILVHRLVMYAFVGVNKDMTVNHKDENKFNNHLSNLEYLSIADNVRYWNNNNKDLFLEKIQKFKKASNEVRFRKVHDSVTNRIFDSIKHAAIFMQEETQINTWKSWAHKIHRNKVERLRIIN